MPGQLHISTKGQSDSRLEHVTDQRGPGFFNTDMGLRKTFPVYGESLNLGSAPMPSMR